MAELLEVRWHARGGQGAKTAAILLAEAASAAGMHVQGFPEYGPERMGAPILAFNRVSSDPIYVHSHVDEPRIVMVLDPSLIGKVDVADGVLEGGSIIVNTDAPAKQIREQIGAPDSVSVYTVDASKISLETIGRDIPNTPMMGALLKVSGLMDYQKFMDTTKDQLESKFRGRTEIIEGNLKAIERAYREVDS